ncbi:MAG: HAD hydrolase family protein [Flavobacteriaceae bacterium]|nr:HAD hydrolase family protein [Flavobacteriaceae bacterium]
MEKSYKEYLQHITTFVFDVDGVLTDGSVLVTTEGDLLRKMNIKDGFALKTAAEQGFHICIISGGSNEGVRKRLEGLGISEIHLGAKNKTEILNNFFQSNDIDSNNVLYMGDDVPDLYSMQMVGLPCCPQDAVPEIKLISKYISHRKGGHGAARDVIEQVLKVQGKWISNGSADANYD